jgi:hypothetical protein
LSSTRRKKKVGQRENEREGAKEMREEREERIESWFE